MNQMCVHMILGLNENSFLFNYNFVYSELTATLI